MVWEPYAIKYLERLCKDEFDGITQTEVYYKPNGELNSLGIFHSMGNKGDALLYVLKRLSINRENVMAIGENTNDLKMFPIAGICVAVGNGAKTIKKQADAVAQDNDSDGVAWVFDEYILSQLS